MVTSTRRSRCRPPLAKQPCPGAPPCRQEPPRRTNRSRRQRVRRHLRFPLSGHRRSIDDSGGSATPRTSPPPPVEPRYASAPPEHLPAFSRAPDSALLADRPRRSQVHVAGSPPVFPGVKARFFPTPCARPRLTRPLPRPEALYVYRSKLGRSRWPWLSSPQHERRRSRAPPTGQERNAARLARSSAPFR
jgi:hypothetical protein